MLKQAIVIVNIFYQIKQESKSITVPIEKLM